LRHSAAPSLSATALGPGRGGGRRSSGAGSPRRSPMEEAALTAADPDALTSFCTATKALAARAQEAAARAACVGV